MPGSCIRSRTESSARAVSSSRRGGEPVRRRTNKTRSAARTSSHERGVEKMMEKGRTTKKEYLQRLPESRSSGAKPGGTNDDTVNVAMDVCACPSNGAYHSPLTFDSFVLAALRRKKEHRDSKKSSPISRSTEDILTNKVVVWTVIYTCDDNQRNMIHLRHAEFPGRLWSERSSEIVNDPGIVDDSGDVGDHLLDTLSDLLHQRTKESPRAEPDPQPVSHSPVDKAFQMRQSSEVLLLRVSEEPSRRVHWTIIFYAGDRSKVQLSPVLSITVPLRAVFGRTSASN